MMDDMTTMGSLDIWPAYLEAVAGTTSRKDIARAISEVTPRPVAPSTISNWFGGKHQPTNAAHVAAVALAYGRSPLEAFVAARLLDIETAAAGLDAESLSLLARLEGGSSMPQTAG